MKNDEKQNDINVHCSFILPCILFIHLSLPCFLERHKSEWEGNHQKLVFYEKVSASRIYTHNHPDAGPCSIGKYELLVDI